MRLALLVLFIALSPAASSAAAETSPATPDFTGRWILDTQLSDLPGRPADSGSRPPRGGGGRPGGRGGGHRGGGNRDQGAGARNGDHPARPTQEYARLEIFQSGSELNITNGLDISRLLYTDGRTVTVWTQRGEAKASAAWVGQSLVVQWETGAEGEGRSQRYSLSEDGLQLTVRDTVPQRKDGKVGDVVRVYTKQK